MKVTDRTRCLLAVCREERRMRAAGYRRCETDWEIRRGARIGDVILDAVVSVDRRHVWTKVGRP